MFQHTSSVRRRKGAIAVLAAVLMVAFIAVVAFAVDIGYILKIRTELQRTADASALAACWEYLQSQPLATTVTQTLASVRSKASQYALSNAVGNASPAVDLNAANAATGDLVLGYIANPSNPSAAMNYTDPTMFNSVQVRVQASEERNGSTPFFFARIFGLSSLELEASATAAMNRNIQGFQTPTDGSNLGILPFALDEVTWNALLAGQTPDSYSWDNGAKTVQSGADGVREVNLYPQGTGSPGNRGTVDIGSNNNSTADLSRQIVNGVSASDLAHHGGELRFNDQGTLSLNGDTGISAGVKDELASIIGKPRMIPIFRTVQGPGNNAQYTIVKFVGVRILAVKLTGSASSKYVMIQPANVVSKGIIPAATSGFSDFIYSSPHLIR
ncbi:MAG: hypothetical protein K8T91_12105 [Planctomycetes bacterium]|nr:hypothetical protein [Planctomycetota bacterium]